MNLHAKSVGHLLSRQQPIVTACRAGCSPFCGKPQLSLAQGVEGRDCGRFEEFCRVRVESPGLRGVTCHFFQLWDHIQSHHPRPPRHTSPTFGAPRFLHRFFSGRYLFVRDFWLVVSLVFRPPVN
jgi:hypothetical protein